MENVSTRDFIASIGGYQTAAARLGRKPQTVHIAMQSGEFPAHWYFAFCQIAEDLQVSKPPRSLFSFLKIDGEAA